MKRNGNWRRYSKDGLFDGEIGRVSYYKHRIEILTQAPYKKRTYPIPDRHKNAVSKYLHELENKEIVRKQATRYVNPLVVVVKKNGQIRCTCVSMHRSWIIEWQTVMLSHQPSMKFSVGSNISDFSQHSIYQIYFDRFLWMKNCRSIQDFYSMGLQTYVFSRMPFGLKTAGASFTRAMNTALCDKHFETVIVYLDVLIASETLEEI